MHRKMRSNLLLILTAFIWGVAFVAQSVGMDYVGPFTFISVRNFIATIVLLLCIKILDRCGRPVGDCVGAGDTGDNNCGNICAGEKGNIGCGIVCTETNHLSNTGTADGRRRNHGGKTLIIGGIACGVCLAVASSFQQIGLNYTTVGKAGFITAMYIVAVPILGLFVGKKVRLISWISVGIAVFGLYLLCMTENLTLSRGDLLVLICAFCFALHILCIDHFSPKVDGVRMSCIQFFTCGILCGIPALIFESPDIRSILAAWLPILYAGALSSAAGYTLQIIAQKNTEPVIASLLMSLESVFSVLAGWVLLHQKLSTREMLGCFVIFAAIILTQLPSPKTAEEEGVSG